MATVEKQYIIKAAPKKVYEALTSENLIEQWSGATAKMDISPEGVFSLWGETIHGVNKEVTEERIVQLWKEESWQDYSSCVFTIEKSDDSTVLTLTHTDVPESSARSIDQGWDEYYLGPLKELLEN